MKLVHSEEFMPIETIELVQKLLSYVPDLPKSEKEKFSKKLQEVAKQIKKSHFPYPEIVIGRCLWYCFQNQASHEDVVKAIKDINRDGYYKGLHPQTFRSTKFTIKDLPIKLNVRAFETFLDVMTDEKKIYDIRMFISNASSLEVDIDTYYTDNNFIDQLDNRLMGRMLPA